MEFKTNDKTYENVTDSKDMHDRENDDNKESDDDSGFNNSYSSGMEATRDIIACSLMSSL